jgi:hypothetical protein
MTLPDPLEALRDDPAVLAADPESRRWLLAILTFGERAAGPSPTAEQPPRPPRVQTRMKKGRHAQAP